MSHFKCFEVLTHPLPAAGGLRICDALPLSACREGRKTDYSVFGVSELKYDIISI